MTADQAHRDRWRRYWDKHSASYDKEMRFFDRVLFGDSRAWVCSQATGDTLEVAVGTGLNLPLYPAGIRLTGIDLSPAMLAIAKQRAHELGQGVDLREGDAEALPFPGESFDTVVCTFSLCAIPDERRAVSEMTRVLRPGGLLLLADHIAAAAWPARAIQRVLEIFTVPLQGEHFLRRPLHQARAQGLTIERRERFKLGLTERLAARKPAPTQRDHHGETSATGGGLEDQPASS
jgi:ubiquinone/menaquinone biosynthesis C-methylase UbiE